MWEWDDCQSLYIISYGPFPQSLRLAPVCSTLFNKLYPRNEFLMVTSTYSDQTKSHQPHPDSRKDPSTAPLRSPKGIGFGRVRLTLHKRSRGSFLASHDFFGMFMV